jgi:tetratricopeptide (TPR) repeat protein
MISHNNQEQDPQIQKLRKLLDSVPVRKKPEHELVSLENALFSRLDSERRVKPQSQSVFQQIIESLALLMRPVPAMAAVAAALLIGISGTVYFVHYSAHQSMLSGSRILNISGQVTMGGVRQQKALSPLQVPRIRLGKSQVYETGAGSSVMVRLDAGSALCLQENTRLTVMEADAHRLVFFLHKGEIFATVSKRARDQVFTIATPNAQCKVVGTIFGVAVRPEGPSGAPMTRLCVYEGVVQMRAINAAGVAASVGAGQSLSMTGPNPDAALPVAESADAIRAITLLKLSLEIADDTACRYGLVDCESFPSGATVSIDGQRIGRTPLILKRPAGRSEVTISCDGYAAEKNLVTVRAKQATDCYAQLVPMRAQDVRGRAGAWPAEDAVHGALINFPEYIEALIQLTIGEYRKALDIFDSLNTLPVLGMHEHAVLAKKAVECYRSLGDFTATLEARQKEYDAAKSPGARGSLLWEIAMIKANCQGDFGRAANDLEEYIKDYPDGPWIHEAFDKRAEALYLDGRMPATVQILREHVRRFPKSPEIDQSLYYLAEITSHELNNCADAINWYARLVRAPGSRYRENALFGLAECYTRLGNEEPARKAYQDYIRLFPKGTWRTACNARLAALAAL